MKIVSKLLCSIWAITLLVMLNFVFPVGASGMSVSPIVFSEQMQMSIAYDAASSSIFDYDSASTLPTNESENRFREEGGVFAQFAEFLAAKTAPEATGFLGSKGFELKNLQAVRNTPEVIGGQNFSAHALDQMQNRGIMPSVVENTIKQGTQFPGNTAATTGFYDSVNNVRVIVNSQNGTVVTVIRGAP